MRQRFLPSVKGQELDGAKLFGGGGMQHIQRFMEPQ
jgi:hypothetical protein